MKGRELGRAGLGWFEGVRGGGSGGVGGLGERVELSGLVKIGLDGVGSRWMKWGAAGV